MTAATETKPRSKRRASGKTSADEEAARETKELDKPVEPDGDPIEGGLTGGAVTRPEDRFQSLTPGFSRLRTDWNSPDKPIVDQIKGTVDQMIQSAFGEVFDIMYALYDLVREPVYEINTKTGEMLYDGDQPRIQRDAFGLPIWAKHPGTNSYVEHWDRLGYREREEYLFKITTGVFAWKQTAADMWAEAMLARAQFEEAFAQGWDKLKDGTVEDHTAHARRLAADYRYHSVYVSYLSRRADAVVSSIELLGQRLKDLITS